jgi:hypothetical protein
MLAATDWNKWVAIGTLALAGMTVVAAMIAVFQEPIRRHFIRAILSMDILLTPPDTHQIDGTHPVTGALMGKLLYVRIRVTHLGGRPAENTEIVAAHLWRRANHGSWETVPTFLPLSLAWSHSQPRAATIRVPAGLFRHCHLGRFQPNPDGSGDPVFVFDLIVQPNPVAGGVLPNVLQPGEYRFELVLGGDNTSRITKRWTLKFSGPWSDDETTMLSQIEVAESR